ncbi:hypothetical protein ACFYO9_34090 [Streptomyces sp. NPDC005863]|uniref:hypothetical protein n=1 Tax=Streptomyces sp. NPDC005863 TaxID=3364735 RepID=UPI0036905184
MAANARTAARKKTTARPPRQAAPAARETEPEEDFEDDDAAAAQEAEAEGHFVTALLADEEIRVVPPGAWRQSWQSYLRQGLFEAFAEAIVHPEDLELYFEVDPTNDEFEAFVEDAMARSGESQGKSRGPNRSTRRTRKR